MPRQHVVPHNGEWAVRPQGSAKVTGVFGTQAEAIAAARPTAKNQHTEMVIHRPNGQIRDSESYGNDPFPPRG